MANTIEFYFDFASPNSYLVHKTLPAMAAERGAELIYRPVLLGGLFKLTNNLPPFMRFQDTTGRLDYEQLEIKRFVQRHGLTKFRMNPHFPINTIHIMRGYLAAVDAGIASEYLDACFEAMWEKKQNTGDTEILISSLETAGLPAAQLLEAAQTESIKTALMSATQDAAERGVFGVPMFFCNNEMFFGKERLEQVLELV